MTPNSPSPAVRSWKGRERRIKPRFPSEKTVRILLPGKGVSLHGRLLDLSEGGCRVEPSDPYLVWNEIRVEVRLESSNVQFKLEGVTKGCRGGKSFGIQFDTMSAEQLRQLHSMFPACAQQAASEDSLPEQVAATPSEDPNQTLPLVRNEGAPGGRERRKHPSFILNTPGTLHEIATGDSTPGTLVEISRTGCRFHLDDPFVRQFGTPLELILDVKGITLRVAGVVRAQINKKTIGIMFDTMSFRRGDQLDELISEIKSHTKPT